MDTTSGTSLEVRSPFPGLRPFLDTESSIFFGRESQVQQVIEHLRATRFIALLGGSGSGKSSLIRAGVLPTLRGYGIREAGDFWVPVLCTPGTNLAGADRRRVSGRRRSTGSHASSSICCVQHRKRNAHGGRRKRWRC